MASPGEPAASSDGARWRPLAERHAERYAERHAARIVLVLILVAAAVILGRELRHGWFPHDEGSLGQSAERALGGEVPHRDFDEIYTGLLSYVHAAVYAVTGPGLVPLRVLLLCASLAWLAGLYRILLRFAPPLAAGAGALTVFIWSVPNYPAAIPSWYIVFAATFGALALLKWREAGMPAWLVVAGAMGGVAFLFKLSGIFFWLGGGLALLALPEPEDRRAMPFTAADRAVNAVVALVIVLVLGALVRVTGRGDRELLRFAVPLGALIIVIATRAARGGAGVPRWRTLRDRVSRFVLGAAIPLGALLLFFAATGGLGAMLEGVFVTPFRRIASASMRPPPVASLAFVVPVMLLLWLPTAKASVRRLAPYLAAALASFVLLRSAPDLRFYWLGWLSAWGLLFVVAFDGAQLAGGRTAAPAGPARDGAFILACTGVGMALVEYPFAAPVYTAYALPLLMLAAFALVRVRGRAAPGVQAVTLGFFLLFGLMRILPGTVGTLGVGFAHSGEDTPLSMARGGLYVDRMEASVYNDVTRFVQETAHGRAIWAGPDAPEVYFLTGLPNHTRTFFDFLDSPAEMERPLVTRLQSIGAEVVVIKLRPQFSAGITAAQTDSLRAAYPNRRGFPGFLVLWK